MQTKQPESPARADHAAADEPTIDDAIAEATWAVTAGLRIHRPVADCGPLAATQEDTLRFL